MDWWILSLFSSWSGQGCSCDRLSFGILQIVMCLGFHCYIICVINLLNLCCLCILISQELRPCILYIVCCCAFYWILWSFVLLMFCSCCISYSVFICFRNLCCIHNFLKTVMMRLSLILVSRMDWFDLGLDRLCLSGSYSI